MVSTVELHSGQCSRATQWSVQQSYTVVSAVELHSGQCSSAAELHSGQSSRGAQWDSRADESATLKSPYGNIEATTPTNTTRAA